MSKRIRLTSTLVVLAALVGADTALAGRPAEEVESFATAEGLVAALYDEVTFSTGSAPDWDRVRSMFIDQAVMQFTALTGRLAPREVMREAALAHLQRSK